MSSTDAVASTSSEIDSKLQLVRAGYASGVVADIERRKQHVQSMRRMLVEHESDFLDALATDLHKSPTEAYVTEIGFLLNEIDHTLSQLAKWAAPRRAKLPFHLRPGRAHTQPQPLGTMLIIAPWNYPLQLSLGPLIPAIAAGNTAIVKPSEVAPATAAALERFLPRFLDSSVAQVVLGGVDETTRLLAEPFDHIVYTGNGTVGRIVMRAAAEHLTPVTLELGGKSPAIVTDTANLAVTARRVAWGKFTNAGQTCVAPDYLLVDEAVTLEFLTELQRAIVKMWGADPAASPDYGRIIDTRHFDRLKRLLVADGQIVIGGESDRDARYIAPTVIADVDGDAAVMQDEIFGPILPVLSYTDLAGAIEFVNARPAPLALYVFTDDDATADRVLRTTSSGGACVNHTLMHLAVPDLPFGGVGASGFGAYHGEVGFNAFSHQRAILSRRAKPDPAVAYPPYTGTKRRLLKRLT